MVSFSPQYLHLFYIFENCSYRGWHLLFYLSPSDLITCVPLVEALLPDWLADALRLLRLIPCTALGEMADGDWRCLVENAKAAGAGTSLSCQSILPSRVELLARLQPRLRHFRWPTASWSANYGRRDNRKLHRIRGEIAVSPGRPSQQIEHIGTPRCIRTSPVHAARPPPSPTSAQMSTSCYSRSSKSWIFHLCRKPQEKSSYSRELYKLSRTG